MGWYRKEPWEIEAMSFRDMYSMYNAALVQELRNGAYQILAVHGGRLQDVAPYAFPELGGARIYSKDQISARMMRSYERRAREQGITWQEAMEQMAHIKGMSPVARA